MAIYPMQEKLLTHSGGDTGGDDAEPIVAKAALGKKKATTVRPISQQGQLLDSTGKMTKSRALALGSDRAARGSR